MSLLALFLILAAASCHAIWNFLVKRIDGGPELVWLFSTWTCIIYLPLVVIFCWIEPPAFGVREWLFLSGSASIHMAYFLLLQQGYKKGDLSLVYPTARATGPFLSIILAVLILGETVTPQIIVGGVAIIIGIFFLTGGFRREGTKLTTSLTFGLATGVLIGSYTAWDAYSVTVLAIPPLILDYASSICRAVLLSPYAITRRALVRQHWRNHKIAVLCVAVFNSLAFILFLIALTFTPLVYAAPAREVSVLITVMLGTLLLGEGNFRQRIAWALLIMLGMVLLTTG
ncbi:DMT family transporter [Sneathiella marina]|uniref:DMT family transporter n=1 Tax=Sneathiella marina TaxID=2950108 RepID=A0ABY4W743_9PROT|nr:DMT family transporter [Sneathiella marina]USG61742.1 DMT family transporter [Sneathiella marina]